MAEKDRTDRTRLIPVKLIHPLGWVCENCFHAVKDPTPGSTAMKCSRNPPRSEAIKQQGNIVGWMSITPPVQMGEWCGEFESIEEGIARRRPQ